MQTGTHSYARRWALADIAGVTLLLATYIWWWRGRFALDKAVLIVALLAWSAMVHRARRESFGSATAQSGSVMPALRLTAIIGGPALLALVTAFVWRRPPHPSWSVMAQHWLMFLSVGVAQQYLLLVHMYRSMLELVTRSGIAMPAAALIFALLHLANPFLMIATAIVGYAACWIYQRARNVWVLGLAHGTLSCALYYALPRAITLGLKIGPQLS